MAADTPLVAGVDSHKDTIHVAVITTTGTLVDDQEFTTTTRGYRDAITWLGARGTITTAGVEGTSSYGRGITTALLDAGIAVIEVNRTAPADKRKRGKTDQLDAYRAARAVLSGQAATAPKDASIEPMRALLITRRSAVKAQQAAWRQIQAILITSPAPLRDKYRAMPKKTLLTTLAGTRPTQVKDDATADLLTALRILARRHHDLTGEITTLDARLDQLVTAANPALHAIKGVGPAVGSQLLITAGDNPDRLRSEASFAALCGTAPVPVSSGKTHRHRVAWGGDRQANTALHHIATNRLTWDQRTKDYRDRQLARGKTKADIMRMLKRAIAREIHHALTGRCTAPDYSDLRPTRQAKNITLTAAAHHLGVWPSQISHLELGRRRDDELANTYRHWLAAA